MLAACPKNSCDPSEKPADTSVETPKGSGCFVKETYTCDKFRGIWLPNHNIQGNCGSGGGSYVPVPVPPTNTCSAGGVRITSGGCNNGAGTLVETPYCNADGSLGVTTACQ